MGITFGRILLVIARPLAWFLFPFKLIGRENIPADRPVVVCCNHISALDPLFLLYGCRRPIFFMGKEELFKNPLAAWFLKKLFGVFAVTRGSGDKSVIEQALSIVRNGDMMGIFPEGTRSKDGTLGRAKSGASLCVAQSGVDVLPCAVFTKSGKVR
ncbi:MAG: 1-acyl-sn-glycerol-3-phosphate acyltransferase, partial [Clostridia bacterium]|nr:1-acyl-sn-glycerol-3-phosphate acyltransferase [Clostridia bacterium]